MPQNNKWLAATLSALLLLSTGRLVAQQPIRKELVGHTAAVTTAIFTANSKFVVTAGADQLIKIWDAQTGKEVRTLAGHTSQVLSLANSPDGSVIISGAADNSIRMWDLPQAGPTRAFSAAALGSRGVAVSNNGDMAVCFDASVGRIWSLRTGKVLHTLRGQPTVHAVAIRRDNNQVASGDSKGNIRIWSPFDGKSLSATRGHTGPVTGLAFTPNNQRLVSIAADGKLKVWQLPKLSLVKEIAVEGGAPTDITLMAGGSQAVTAGAGGVIQWNLGNGARIRQFATAKGQFTSVDATSNNTQLIAADNKGKLWIWNMSNGQVLNTVEIKATVQQVRYSPDNLKIVATCGDRRLRFFNSTDGKLSYELTSDQPVSCGLFLDDNRHVLTGGAQLRQWRFASPTPIRVMNGHGGGVYGLTYSHDGQFIASASADQTVRIWNAKTGAAAKQLRGHRGAVYSVSFSPDGALLISAGAEKNLRLWDTLGGRQLKQIPVGNQSLYSVAFFADGKRVAAAGLDRKIYVLNAFTGQLQSTLAKHPDYLHRVTFNQQGTRLLSCGYAGNIILWNTSSQRPIHTMTLRRVASFADYSPDGKQIVVASGDGKAYLLDVPAKAQ